MASSVIQADFIAEIDSLLAMVDVDHECPRDEFVRCEVCESEADASRKLQLSAVTTIASLRRRIEDPEAARRVQRASRPTVMDGRVEMFAQHFITKDGGFGDIHKAVGPYEVSASRNCVVVHRAEVSGKEALEELIAALRMAFAEHERMKAARGW